MGRSGSGKTTLLNIIGGLDRPTSGAVRVDGTELYGLDDRALSLYRNERVGFVFQSFHLTGEETALENVLVPFLFARRRRGAGAESGRDRVARGEAALEGVGLAEQRDQPAATLSAGQKQRVAIARAFVNDPDFILADEPTGNLDQETGAGVVGKLEELGRDRGLGIIIVTHDPAITAVADRLLRLDAGRLV